MTMVEGNGFFWGSGNRVNGSHLYLLTPKSYAALRKRCKRKMENVHGEEKGIARYRRLCEEN